MAGAEVVSYFGVSRRSALLSFLATAGDTDIAVLLRHKVAATLNHL